MAMRHEILMTYYLRPGRHTSSPLSSPKASVAKATEGMSVEVSVCAMTQNDSQVKARGDRVLLTAVRRTSEGRQSGRNVTGKRPPQHGRAY